METHCAQVDLVKLHLQQREQLQHQSKLQQEEKGLYGLHLLLSQFTFCTQQGNQPILGHASRPYSPYGAPSRRVARPGPYNRAIQAVQRTSSQAVRSLGEGEGCKIVEGKYFSSDKFQNNRCKISEFALFPEIIKITKQKIDFPSWVFSGSFDKKITVFSVCECLCLYVFISVAFRVFRKSTCSYFCIKKFSSAFYLFKSATRF